MAFSPEAAFSYLRQAHERGRLAHAYLIAGPADAGKRRLASRLANLVQGTEEQDVFTSALPDVYLAEPASKSRRIVIEQIRGLEHALQMRATDGRRKVAILAEADRLQPQAANACLKTLEEPHNASLLLLLSALPEALPETIVSRCLPLPLAAPMSSRPSAEEEEVIALLGKFGLTSDVQGAYRLAQGFQSLLRKLREGIQAENAAAQKAEETRYKQTTDGTWLADREDYFKALTESAYLQRRAQLIEVLFRWWADVLRASSGLESQEIPRAREATRALAAKLTVNECLQRIRRIEALRDHLGRNIQEALAVEVAFLSVFR
ncbi:MAG: hypothetical protein ACR2HH_00310 [Chthoniobacterales bacterium]